LRRIKPLFSAFATVIMGRWRDMLVS